MKEKELNKKIFNATKWSSITEIVAKFTLPIMNMILARLLTPEAFGVIATITMVTSFADMLTDAGFQKYLVQKDFKSDSEKEKYTNVAFITNLIFSLLIWGIIIIFNREIANLVGNPGLGTVLIIACIQLPLTAFSSIQMALYRRSFNFKTLFFVRIISLCIPIFITIPLAYLGFGYWALIIGTISIQLSNAIILTIKSKWKPRFYFNIKILRNMLSFSLWSLIEAISIWLTVWIDTFIIGSLLNEYFLGVYKTSTTMVNSLLSIVTAAVVPVLFAALSRLKNNEREFQNLYLNMQRIVAMLIFPLGVGVYLFNDLVRRILLGEQWVEAGEIIGIWALSSCLLLVYGNLSSEAYRAKGLPKLSFLAQLLHLIILVPICIYFAKYGFWELVYARTIIRLQLILVHFIILKYVLKISIRTIIKNTTPILISTMIMGLVGWWVLKINSGVLWEIITITLCILIYCLSLLLFKNIRNELKGFIRKFINNKYNSVR